MASALCFCEGLPGSRRDGSREALDPKDDRATITILGEVGRNYVNGMGVSRQLDVYPTSGRRTIQVSAAAVSALPNIARRLSRALTHDQCAQARNIFVLRCGTKE